MIRQTKKGGKFEMGMYSQLEFSFQNQKHLMFLRLIGENNDNSETHINR